ncbi:MAG: succinate dehydrogenase cytochrome b subunit [Gemmatimonadales bacterium]
MNRAVRFYRSAIGKKVVMAVTGLIGIAFLVGHVAGNLLAFRGSEALNAYSAFLKSTGELLWIVRIVLITAVILHVIAAYHLTIQNRAARPISYSRREPQVSTIASRTMRWGGALLLIFIIIHILHFTTGTIRPTGLFSPTDVYGNVIGSFRIWWVSLFYIISMIALGAHIYHGAWSSVRTIGIAQPSPNQLHRRVALALALLLWLGFTAVPAGVLLGLIR